MLSNKYNYQDDEPIIKKTRKPREKKVKEVKEVDEPEVYKIIRETREARLKPTKEIIDEDDAEDDDAEDTHSEIEAYIAPLTSNKTTKFEGGSSNEKVKKTGNLALNGFHPLALKYDTKFVDTLKTENEELKKHLHDLRKLHSYNDRLNHINHTAHRMKIKLSQF